MGLYRLQDLLQEGVLLPACVTLEVPMVVAVVVQCPRSLVMSWNMPLYRER